MNSADLVSMIGHLSRSLYSVGNLIAGLGYVIGILFIFTALTKLKSVSGHSSQEKMFGSIAYFVGGAALIFLPSMMQIVSNTAFGSGNILQYVQYNPYSIYNSMGILIQTAGLIWFVRGCVLMVHSSDPGVQYGTKGLIFIGAGILAMNFQYTMGLLSYALDGLMRLSGLATS